jgi:tripartite-type tricarboxylate transporter receptor subunit TctC
MRRLLARDFRIAGALLIALLSLTVSFSARAAWPDNRTITFVVPFPPGGNTDLLGRIVANKLSASLGVTVVVENKPGAGSMIGSQAVAKAAPDGHTILMGSIANVINDAVYAKPLLNVRKDLIPVSQVVNVPNYIAANPKLPVNSLAEYIAYVKKNPGKSSCATSGIGTSPFVSCELFKRMAGLDLLVVPYQGGLPAMQDVMGGRVDIAVVNEALPYIRSKQLKGLAVTTATRSPYVPELPAIAESVPGYEVTSWYGVFLPAGTPKEIVDKLGAELPKAMRSDDVKKLIEPVGAVAVGSTPAEFQKFVNSALDTWAKVTKEMGIRLNN